MNRKVILFLLSTITVGIVNGEILASNFEPKPFNEDEYIIYIYPWLNQQKPIETAGQHYDFSFKDSEDKYEVRYTMFNQKNEIDELELSVYSWSWMVAQNIIKSEELFTDFSKFGTQDVKNEFNADYGLTTFSKTSATDWTDDYDYMLINFFFKDQIGIMCQTLLFDDLELLKTKGFIDLFHSFKFL